MSNLDIRYFFLKLKYTYQILNGIEKNVTSQIFMYDKSKRSVSSCISLGKLVNFRSLRYFSTKFNDASH